MEILKKERNRKTGEKNRKELEMQINCMYGRHPAKGNDLLGFQEIQSSLQNLNFHSSSSSRANHWSIS